MTPSPQVIFWLQFLAFAILTGFISYALSLLFKKGKRLKVSLLLFILLTIFNPILNLAFLGPINDHFLLRMKSQAESFGLIGRSPEEIRALFGNPTSGDLSEQYGEGTWNFRPIPFYWGSKFQVHFYGHKVVAWEYADD